MSETPLMRRCMLGLSRAGARVFRNNVGMGWAGKLVEYKPEGVTRILHARPLHAGLCEGSSDIVGWVSEVITADMVGRRVAVFTVVEVKYGDNDTTEKQGWFLEAVSAAGGYAGVARTVDEAVAIVIRVSAGKGLPL